MLHCARTDQDDRKMRGTLVIKVVVMMAVCSLSCQGEVRMTECVDGWLSITEGSRNAISCTIPRSETVTWTVTTRSTNVTRTLGSCGPGQSDRCPGSDENVELSRADFDVSFVAIFNNPRELFSDTSLTCSADSGSDTCNIRVTHRAALSLCGINTNTDNKTLSGSCRVDEVFSSDGNYSCQWHIQYPGDSTKIPMPSVSLVTSYTNTGKLYYRGVCSFSYPLPATVGVYTLYFSMPSGPKLIRVGQYTVYQNGQHTASPQRPSGEIEIPVAVNPPTPVTLLCGAGPETQLPYSWRGVACNHGNTDRMCSFTPAGPEMTVYCTATFDSHGLSGLTHTASLRLSFNLSGVMSTTVVSPITSTREGTTYLNIVTTSQTLGGQGETTKPGSFPTAAVVGSIVAFVVVIVTVIVIVLVIRRRRLKTYERPVRRREEETHPYTGLTPPSADSGHVTGIANTQGVYEDIGGEQRQVTSPDNPRHSEATGGQGEDNKPHDYYNTRDVHPVYQNTP